VSLPSVVSRAGRCESVPIGPRSVRAHDPEVVGRHRVTLAFCPTFVSRVRIGDLKHRLSRRYALGITHRLKHEEECALAELRASLLRRRCPNLDAGQGEEAFDQHLLLAVALHRVVRLHKLAVARRTGGRARRCWIELVAPLPPTAPRTDSPSARHLRRSASVATMGWFAQRSFPPLNRTLRKRASSLFTAEVEPLRKRLGDGAKLLAFQASPCR
jgi:hypothetical protein